MLHDFEARLLRRVRARVQELQNELDCGAPRYPDQQQVIADLSELLPDDEPLIDRRKLH
jgi:hypothetical protein